ncbi:phosphotransferase, partial [Staphylococcus aureus]|nr:phosphotransferase [Staphylococcus aureus]
RFQTELLTDAMQSLRRIVASVGPMSVLCHGDFNRNNLLFRYDDGGRPVDALAYDMATMRYGSPVLDLSFFLYMNADRQTR